jgi:hypothetical protein
MGGTTIFTKKAFLKHMEDNLPNDQLVVLTTGTHGDAYAPSKKLPLFRVPFAFAADAFPKGYSLMNFAHNFSGFAAMHVNKGSLSKEAINMVEKLADETL